MSHLDSQTLDALAASRDLPRRRLLHLDRCVTCRRAAAHRGISDRRIADALTAPRSRTRALVVASALAVCAGVTAVVLPVRSAASGFFAFFEPHRVVAVPMTLDEMRSLSEITDLGPYASASELRHSTAATFTDVRAATAAAGFMLRAPTNMPGGMRAMSYLVNGPSTQLLRFGTASAKTAAPLPADFVGSTLRVDLGPTVVTMYATAATRAEELRVQNAMRRMSAAETPQRLDAHGRPLMYPQATSVSGTAAYGVSAPGGPSGPRLVRDSRVVHVSYSGQITVRNAAQPPPAARAYVVGGTGFGLPLVVVQMPAPQIATTGVSAQRLESFMLGQPGVPPRVAAAFRALGDLSTTLPIPVPIDKAYTQPVVVDGVIGVGIGDDTGIGAAVMWQKNGMLYAVFAPRAAREVLAIADSLR